MAKEFRAVARVDDIEAGTLACVRLGDVEITLARVGEIVAELLPS